MQPHPYPNRFGEEGARRARRSPVSLAREVLANIVSPNCHRRRPALGGSALSPRTHESGRPGSSRRRPAWEAFWALVGQGFSAAVGGCARSWRAAAGAMAFGGDIMLTAAGPDGIPVAERRT